METFSHLVNKAALGGFLAGYKVRGRGGEELQITHLLWFEVLFGMCINWKKVLLCLWEKRRILDAGLGAGVQLKLLANILSRSYPWCEA